MSAVNRGALLILVAAFLVFAAVMVISWVCVVNPWLLALAVFVPLWWSRPMSWESELEQALKGVK